MNKAIRDREGIDVAAPHAACGSVSPAFLRVAGPQFCRTEALEPVRTIGLSVMTTVAPGAMVS